MWPFTRSKLKSIQEAFKIEVDKLPERTGWEIIPAQNARFVSADGSVYRAMFRWHDGVCFHRRAGGQTWAFVIIMAGARYRVICGLVSRSETQKDDVKMNRTLSRKDTLRLLESLTAAMKGTAST